MASLALVTPPSSEPLTLTQAKAQLRIEAGITDDDTYISSLISAARRHCEAVTNRQLMPATWKLFLDHWPGSPYHADRYPWTHHVIEIPKPPLQTLTSITYVDPGGNVNTWDPSNYVLDNPVGDDQARARVSLAFTKYWPVLMPQANVVTLLFAAGYADASHVPPDLLQGMLIALTDWYEVRNEGVEDPKRARRLWLPYVSRAGVRQFG